MSETSPIMADNTISGTDAMKGQWHDWVGELFEPAFCSTVEDLVAHEEEPKNKPRVKHVSVHDPEAVRKVYEKVHMMTLLDEEMRRQKRSQKTPQKQEHLQDDMIKTTTASVLKFDENRQPDDKTEMVTVDLNQSCIWDSNEIGVLREAFKSIKQQNIEAMVHARETAKQNQEQTKVITDQRKTIASLKNSLSDAKISNKRLKINVDSLNDEVKYLTAKVGAMEEVIREIKQEHSDMGQELHDNRVTTDRERMERQRIQMKLDNLRREALAEKMAAEDNIRTMCRKAIHDLKEKVKKLENEITEERIKRQSAEKGLNHLRTHFSSLSMQEILPQTVVTENQVGFVDY